MEKVHMVSAVHAGDNRMVVATEQLRNPLRSAISQTPVLWFFCEIIGELFQSKRRGMIRIRYF